MKRLLCFIIALFCMLSLCACSNGGSNAPITDASSLSEKTTRKQIEDLLGTPVQDDKNKDKEDYYTIFYTRVDFLNMFCSPQITFRRSDDTLASIYFETTFDRSKKNGVDEYRQALTNKYGEPKIKFDNNYMEYSWGERQEGIEQNGTTYGYLVIRDDDVVLGRFYYNYTGNFYFN